MRSPSRTCIAPLPLLVLALLGACRGPARAPDAPAGKPEPFVPLPDEGPESIGYFLRRFDRSLQQWSELQVRSSSAREVNALEALLQNLEDRAKKRRDELLEVLESGAPANRRVAAAALGFSKDPTVLRPLLGALSDRDPEVVQKALLGLGVLALPETPLAEVRIQLQNAEDAWTRNNAAFAMLALARAGSRGEDLTSGCRAGLEDGEASVRAQCASALGVVADVSAVPRLEAMLLDPDNLAGLAAAASLASIGREHPEQKGKVARALSEKLDVVRSDRRPHVLGALRWLAQQDFGEDSRAWREWANKMP